jgi:charged multivesicular body protein 3
MFGRKKLSPQEQAREWKKNIRDQVRGLDRQTRSIEREEEKLKTKVKTLMRQGHSDAVAPLVQELVNSRKAKSKILKTKTQLESIGRQIDLQIAQVKVCGCFQQSAEVTHMLNGLVRIPELQQTMGVLQQEMMKAGIAADAVDDTIEMVQEDEEDPELAVRIVFNQIANEVNASAGQTKVQLQPIEPEELQDEPELAASLAH